MPQRKLKILKEKRRNDIDFIRKRFSQIKKNILMSNTPKNIIGVHLEK